MCRRQQVDHFFLLQKFSKLKSIKFKEGPDLPEPEEWTQQFEKLFSAIQCLEVDKVWLVPSTHLRVK